MHVSHTVRTVQVAAPAVKYKYRYTKYKHQHVYVLDSAEQFLLIILKFSLVSHYTLL